MNNNNTTMIHMINSEIDRGIPSDIVLCGSSCLRFARKQRNFHNENMDYYTLYRRTKSQLHVTVFLLSLLCWNTQMTSTYCLIQPLPSIQVRNHPHQRQSQSRIEQQHLQSKSKSMYTNPYHFHKSTVTTTKLCSSKSGNSRRTNVMIANKTSDTRRIVTDSNQSKDDDDDNNNEQQQQQQPEDTTNTIITSEEVKRRTMKQLERLQLKDRMSPKIEKEDLNIIYEDEHLIVINKPAGVLTVSGKDKTYHSLVQTVYEYCNTKNHNNNNSSNNTTITSSTLLKDADHMVVHRLAMDTSGLIVFAKNIETVRGLNTIFRTRDIDRTYEALVCGHIPNKKGRINLPLMRDYEHPLYVRISTDRHQEMLLNLDPSIVGKKILEQPKESITEYKVLNYETLNGQPVTRLLLRNVSGRMHQLNCHLATIGHPIVGDVAYGGINDMALPNGGLSDDELQYLIPSQYNNKQNRVTIEQQLKINDNILHPTCHANMIQFRHPITKQQIKLQSDAPF